MICSKCKLDKLPEEMEKASARYRARQCKTCRNARARELYVLNHEARLVTKYRIREKRKRTMSPAEQETARRQAEFLSRRHRLAKWYRLTLEEYDALVAEQAGVCRICRKPDTRRLAVDHDHSTGAVRGLLCGRCNRGLGSFADSPELLRLAADYLEQAAGTGCGSRGWSDLAILEGK